MIKPITIYTAICDVCGENICDGTTYSGWCKDGLDNELSELGWVEQREVHPDPLPNQTYIYSQYCPKCYTYDENDKLILKEKQNENQT